MVMNFNRFLSLSRGGDLVKKFALVAFVLVLVLALALPAAAQVSTDTLDLDPDELTSGLFTGANIIIAALGAIMFVLAGFKLGGQLLKAIMDAVSSRIF